MLASHLPISHNNLNNALVENAFFLLYVTSGLLFFCFYQLKIIMSKMLLYSLAYILHMGHKMYYETVSILSLLFGRKSPTVFNLLLLFATDSS